MGFETPQNQDETEKYVDLKSPELSETAEKTEGKIEEERSPAIGFYITDHSLRYPEEIQPDDLRELYGEMKKHGISSVRYDWDWREIISQEGVVNHDILKRYTDAIKIMQEVGLEPPTLVFSTPPEWAVELYKKDKEQFFVAYESYLTAAAHALTEANTPIYGIQLFNEVNNALLFKYMDVEDLGRAAQLVRRTIAGNSPDVKISTSLIVANSNEAIAHYSGIAPEIEEFLKRHGAMLKEHFDLLSVDYYPGVWHMPLVAAGYSYKNTFKQLDMFKNICEKIAGMGIAYEIGESGFPTNAPYNDEKTQRYFYDTFFRAFRQMLVDFGERGIPLPERVGLYETQDEPNVSFGGVVEKLLRTKLGKWLSQWTPIPEGDFGLMTETGEQKSILKGRLHTEGDEISQLSRIINYVNRPIKTKKSTE